MVFALPLMAALLAAQAGATPADASAAAAIQAATGGCLALATGAVTISGDSEPARSAAFFTGGGVEAGMPQAGLTALGSGAESMISAATFGHRQVGADRVVLATGGNFPTCRVLITSPAQELDDGEEMIAAAAASGQWRRVNDLPNNGGITQRMFLHRAADRRVFLLLAATGTLPESTVRTLLMVLPAPDNFPLPEGF